MNKRRRYKAKRRRLSARMLAEPFRRMTTIIYVSHCTADERHDAIVRASAANNIAWLDHYAATRIADRMAGMEFDPGTPR